jgi:hypothetical protein
MTISSVVGSSSLALNTTGRASATSGAEGAAAQPEVSKMGQLMSQLQQLQQSDPAKFKQVMGAISQKLKDEAAGATGQRAEFLGGLASRFDQAAQSGDLSALQPPAQAGKAHGHHHHAGYKGGAHASGTPAPGDDLAQIIESALSDAGTAGAAAASG